MSNKINGVPTGGALESSVSAPSSQNTTEVNVIDEFRMPLILSERVDPGPFNGRRRHGVESALDSLDGRMNLWHFRHSLRHR